MEKKTVKYHIPQHGIYMYARTNSGKTELIVLNSTDAEQVVANDHYRIMTNVFITIEQPKLIRNIRV